MKPVLLRYLLVGSAGFIGALARVLLGDLIGKTASNFPLGTLVINITGSFLLGWFLEFCGARHLSDTTRVAIGAGFIGTYTTFSTYMYDSNNLAEKGALHLALANLILSVVLGLIAVKAGVLLARYQVSP
jgi:CrcB protein